MTPQKPNNPQRERKEREDFLEASLNKGRDSLGTRTLENHNLTQNHKEWLRQHCTYGLCQAADLLEHEATEAKLAVIAGRVTTDEYFFLKENLVNKKKGAAKALELYAIETSRRGQAAYDAQLTYGMENIRDKWAEKVNAPLKVVGRSLMFLLNAMDNGVSALVGYNTRGIAPVKDFEKEFQNEAPEVWDDYIGAKYGHDNNHWYGNDFKTDNQIQEEREDY